MLFWQNQVDSKNDWKSGCNCEIGDLKIQFLVFRKNLVVNKIYIYF
jgi:hypothetical protein